MSKRRDKLLNVILLIVVFGAFGAVAVFYYGRYDTFNRENLCDLICADDSWAPFLFVALYIVTSPVPFLAPVLSATSGMLFGPLWGTLLTMLAATLSSFVPFLLARRMGHDWVESKLRGRKIQDVYHKTKGRSGFVIILIMRLIPGLPWELQNYAAGLTKVSPVIYAAATLVGIAPGTLSLNWLGSASSDPASLKFAMAVAFKITLWVAPPAIIIVGRQIRRWRSNRQPLP